MQSKNRPNLVRVSALLAAMVSLAAITGCGISADAPPTNYNAPVQLAGLVLAGRNYMAYATVNIYATQPNGVPTNGTYVGTAKLLGTAKTSITGTWTVDGLSCSSPDQLYVTAVGGTPFPYLNNFTSLTNNPNSLMMTAVGDCSTLTNEDNPGNVTQIITNEASSVAAVWALRPFLSISGTTVNVTSSLTNYGGTNGVGVPGNYAGLAHAFQNANNLNPFREGAFETFTNGANSITTGGLVPVQSLNALAYIQYLCTIGAPDGATGGNFDLCKGNTSGVTGLYPLTTPVGGTAPTNSLQAMLNIANNPTYNAQALMTFAQSIIPGATTGQENYDGTTHDGVGPYIPALTSFCLTTGSCPTQDWTIALYYGPGFGGNTVTGTGAIMTSTVPAYVSVDANDNVFFSNLNSSTSTQGNILSLESNGTYRWGSLTDTTVDTYPRESVPDQFGNLWIASGGTGAGQNAVVQMDATSGAVKNIYPAPATATPLYGITADTLGNVWYTVNAASVQNLYELVKSNNYAEAVFAPSPVPIAPHQLLQVRADANNNIWAAGYSSTGGAFEYFPNTGTASAPTYTAGLISASLPSVNGYGLAVGVNGTAYMSTNSPSDGAAGELYKATVAGAGAASTLSDAPAIAVPEYTSADEYQGRFMDTDGAGNIWFTDYQTTTYLYAYFPSTGALTTFYPCFAYLPQSGSGSAAPPGTNYCGQGTGGSGISTRLDQALDSTGSLWVASYGNSGGGRMVQVISPAAPTVPLKAMGKIGVMP